MMVFALWLCAFLLPLQPEKITIHNFFFGSAIVAFLFKWIKIGKNSNQFPSKVREWWSNSEKKHMKSNAKIQLLSFFKFFPVTIDLQKTMHGTAQNTLLIDTGLFGRCSNVSSVLSCLFILEITNIVLATIQFSLLNFRLFFYFVTMMTVSNVLQHCTHFGWRFY